MLVLGIETSCDETAAAVVRDGQHVLGDALFSQVTMHAIYGGIVPEVASRAHIEKVLPVIDEALVQAGIGIEALDAVAVTRGPGLVGALLVGVQVGKALAWSRGLPLVGVNHLEGHLAAVFLGDGAKPKFPHLGLLVSGGHSEILVVEGHGLYRLLGATRDDAAGEAFDKVGKLCGMGYPAGPDIDRLAATGNPKAVALPRAMKNKGYDMSFSGLKTAVAQHLQGAKPKDQVLADLCASFQAALVDQIVDKVEHALVEEHLFELVVAGGVAANRGLRAGLLAACARRKATLFAPPPSRCTDNAAMIACAGYHRLLAGERADLSLNAVASLPLDPRPSASKAARKGPGVGRS
ncbi:MAG: tRNA (adenosine(37)-N6)-threonylcarbamoyltransferase complex transferase subunit TsaD [Polyangia bacterium]